MSGVGIGEVVDIAIGAAPVDMSLAATTGKRMNMSGVENVTVVFIKGVGTVAEDPVLTLKQHTLSAAGTSTNLVAVSTYYTKSGGPSLAGSEIWVANAQPGNATLATVTLTGSAVNQMICAFNVPAEALAAGNGWISVDVSDPGAGAQFGTVLYLLRSDDRRAAPAMPAPLRA